MFIHSMMFVFPPIMYLRAIWKQRRMQGASAKSVATSPVFLVNMLLLLLGAGLGFGGTVSNIMALKRK